jgi:hypothetical protein
MESVYHIVTICVNETSWAHVWRLHSRYLGTGYDILAGPGKGWTWRTIMVDVSGNVSSPSWGFGEVDVAARSIPNVAFCLCCSVI